MTASTITILGLVLAAYLLLLKWVHGRASGAHKAIEAHRVEGKADMRAIYDRIGKGEAETHLCRQEIERDMKVITQSVNDRMSESQIKDFVDREVKPINEELKELKVSVKDGNNLSIDLLSKVQILLDREKS